MRATTLRGPIKLERKPEGVTEFIKLELTYLKYLAPDGPVTVAAQR